MKHAFISYDDAIDEDYGPQCALKAIEALDVKSIK